MAFDIGMIFAQWQQAGIYEFVLPLLLVFAIVFGILNTTNIMGKQKNLQLIIAVVVALMSVTYSSRMNFSLGQFLGEAFPRLAVGLSVLLVIMILIGMFVPKDDRRFWLIGLAVIGVIIAIVVITKSFETFGFSGGGYENYIGWIVGAILIVGLIIAVASSGGGEEGGGKDKKVIIATSGNDWTKE